MNFGIILKYKSPILSLRTLMLQESATDCIYIISFMKKK